MRDKFVKFIKEPAVALLVSLSIASLLSRAARAQTAAPQEDVATSDSASAQLQEIVVTAQKRSQSINDVGMSITAVSGEQLLALGITSVGDLANVVPGFTYNQTAYATPVYSIRGVGFQENSLAASPAVSVYVDEVPIPFSVETTGAALDLERVEVLKGPQGTLYGLNSTGGAVNYIAAKPTNRLSAGLNVSYGRFDSTDVSGYISGPLTDTLKARAALRFLRSDDWQQSYSRPAQLGAQNQVQGRVLLEWRPLDPLSLSLNLNGWLDQSDTPAAQLVGINPAVPAVGLPAGFANYPLAPADARAADWDPGVSFRRNNHFYQGSVRADYTLTPNLTLTSISSYEDYRRRQPLDGDGTPYQGFTEYMSGDVKTFFQELRLSGALTHNRGHWILGANYEHDKSVDDALLLIGDSSNRVILGFPTHSVLGLSDQDVRTKAAYGNVEYQLLPSLSALAGVRYTKADRGFSGCAADAGDGAGAVLFNFLSSLLRGGAPGRIAGPGGCLTLDQNFEPGLIRSNLDQSNTSWRLGLNYKPAHGVLLYTTISKGYKAGSFPTLSGTTYKQYAPVTQESVLAYEVGEKATLLDKTLQLNAAAFYYNYKEKQIRGRLSDPIFGALEALVNIPESHVDGIEVSATWRPVRGLTLSPSVTFVASRIDGNFYNYDLLNKFVRLSGESFPYTPRWSGNVDAEYRFGVTPSWDAYVGANSLYHDSTNGGFGELQEFRLKAYLLLDLRAGIESADGRWRIGAYAENVTDEYYWLTATQEIDTGVRYAGMPRTYGVSIAYSFK